MSLKEITLEEAFSLGIGESYHLYIKQPKVALDLLGTLEERGVLWRSGTKPTEGFYIIENKEYPIVLTINNIPVGKPCMSVASVKGIDDIPHYWAMFSSRGVVIVDRITEKVKIKRKDKI